MALSLMTRCWRVSPMIWSMLQDWSVAMVAKELGHTDDLYLFPKGVARANKSTLMLYHWFYEGV